MDQHSREPSAGSSDFFAAGWFDPIEVATRDRVRGFIEALLEEELAGTLSPPHYGRLKPGEDEAAPPVAGASQIFGWSRSWTSPANAIVLPSGDHAGFVLDFFAVVSACVSPVATSPIHRFLSKAFSSQFVFCTS